MKKPPIHVVAAVIRSKGSVLMASRPIDKPPEGWEFPGGKVEPGESLNQALVRELKEELALDVTPADEIYQVRTEKIILHFIRAAIKDNQNPAPQEKQTCRWIELSPGYPAGILTNDRIFWDFLTCNL